MPSITTLEGMRSLADDLFARQRLFDDRESIERRLHALAPEIGADSSTSLSAAFDLLYQRLRLLYPSEFVLKSEIVNRVFLARHDPREATVLTEMRVGKNRVDLVVVNGTTTAYEVKSRFDSLARLTDQLDAYLRVFERVFVVCDKAKAQDVLGLARPEVGVMVSTASGGFRYARKAASSPLVDRGSIFACMRKPEYIRMAARRFDDLPEVPNMRQRAAFHALLETLPMQAFQQEFARVLRERGSHPSDATAMNQLPYGMRLRYYELPKELRSRCLAWI